MKLLYEDVKKYFKDNGYELLETEYKNAKTKMKYKCPNGHCNEISWDNFKRGRRCPNCYGKNIKHTYEEVYNFFQNEGYTLLSKEYVNGKGKIEYVCPNGHIHSTTWLNFLKGNRCPSCSLDKRSEKRRMDFSVIQKAFKDKGYILLSKNVEYKNNHTSLGYICSNGHSGFITWNNFKKGEQCPRCTNIYKGENKIEEYLKKSNIQYIHQKIFKDCKNIQSLRFDFYLPIYNLIIEYDGLQHFKPVDFAGKGDEWAKERFYECQSNDKIKDEYCIKNSINLLRIPYWEFDNIENIIYQEIEKLKTFDGQVS